MNKDQREEKKNEMKKSVKKVKKQSTSKAEAIRRAARKILQENKREMGLNKLFEAVREEISCLRSDFFRQSITSLDSRMDVKEGIVFLKKRKYERKEKEKTMKTKKASSKKSKKRNVAESKQQNVAEFTLLAIEKLRDPKYKSIHSVYSGFNAAFREYFPDLDPVKEIGALAEKGVVNIRFIKGGVLIYPGKSLSPKTIGTTGKDALKKMGLAR